MIRLQIVECALIGEQISKYIAYVAYERVSLFVCQVKRCL